MNSLSKINYFSDIYHFSNDQVLSKLAPLQKKLGIVVLAVFTCMGAIYLFWSCRKKIQSFYSRKDNVLAKEVIKPPTLLQAAVPQLKSENNASPNVALSELKEEFEDEKENQAEEFQILTENAKEPALEHVIKPPTLLQPVVSQLKPKNEASPDVALSELKEEFEDEKENQAEEFQLSTENAIKPLPIPASVPSLSQIKLTDNSSPENASLVELQEKIAIKPLNDKKLKISNLQDVIQLVEKHPNKCSSTMMEDIKQLTLPDIRFISDQVEILDNYFRSNLSNHSHSFVKEEVVKGVFTFNRHDLHNFHYKINGNNRPDGTGMSNNVTSCYQDNKQQKFQFSTCVDRFQYIIDSYILLHMQDIILGICEARSFTIFVYGHQKGIIPDSLWATPYSSVVTANGEYPIRSTIWEINDLGRCVPKQT